MIQSVFSLNLVSILTKFSIVRLILIFHIKFSVYKNLYLFYNSSKQSNRIKFSEVIYITKFKIVSLNLVFYFNFTSNYYFTKLVIWKIKK